MDIKPCIYYIHGKFFIFKKDDILSLRKSRVVGQLVGCLPSTPHQPSQSGLPYLLSHNAVKLVLDLKLASFRRLVPSNKDTFAERLIRYENWLASSIQESSLVFEKKKIQELKNRNVLATPDRLKGFEPSKVRVSILDLPCDRMASMDSIEMRDMEVELELSLNDGLYIAYRDLYERGLYVNSGFKFGCDFLAYIGDPVRYHAKYALRLVSSCAEGDVDFKRINHHEINALNRLSHNSNKIPLLITLHNHSVRYWLLRDRNYLIPDSATNSLSPFDPAQFLEETKESIKDRCDEVKLKVQKVV